MDWEPIKTLRTMNGPVELPQVDEPPCRWCQHWRPERLRDNEGKTIGIRCCWSELQHQDFSCFTPLPADVRARKRLAKAIEPVSPVSPNGAPYETFLWSGQLRYRCNRQWPNSNTRCEYDTHDLHQMNDHVRSIHTTKKATFITPPMPTLFDADGKQVERRYESPAEPGEPEFKWGESEL